MQDVVPDTAMFLTFQTRIYDNLLFLLLCTFPSRAFMYKGYITELLFSNFRVYKNFVVTCLSNVISKIIFLVKHKSSLYSHKRKLKIHIRPKSLKYFPDL